MTAPQINVIIENPNELTKKQVVDQLVVSEISEFDQWLTSTFQGTGQLTSYERALIKTYIMHKLEGQMSELKG